MKYLINPALLLLFTVPCLFEVLLHRQSETLRECEAALLSLQWMFILCLAVWCSALLLWTISLNDVPLIGLVMVAIVTHIVCRTVHPATDAPNLLFGLSLGKCAFILLRRDDGRNSGAFDTRYTSLVTYLVGLVVLLAFASLWHLDITNNFYHGPRWMGLWNNPNDYGMLMGAGMLLAVGLLAASLKSIRLRPTPARQEVQGPKSEGKKQKAEMEKRKAVASGQQSVVGSQNPLRSLAAVKSAIGNWRSAILLVAAFMMGVGLVMSYSRGAWLGTAVGLLYLVKAYGKFKWRWVLPPVLLIAAVVWFFWGSTSDKAPWFVKRADLGRPSAQHRVVAWKAGFEIMRDHPFGVGWNKAVETYQKKYSPPEGGAAAIATNDYLMLGTQLGIPGLACFVAYVALCFRKCPHLTLVLSPPAGSGEGIKIACRAGTLAMLVAFWFDGGLFKLATASVFWILLELGAERRPKAING